VVFTLVAEVVELFVGPLEHQENLQEQVDQEVVELVEKVLLELQAHVILVVEVVEVDLFQIQLVVNQVVQVVQE
jgi:hypothetical protein